MKNLLTTILSPLNWNKKSNHHKESTLYEYNGDAWHVAGFIANRGMKGC